MPRYEDAKDYVGDAGMRIPPRWEHEGSYQNAEMPVQEKMPQYAKNLGSILQPVSKQPGIGDMLEISYSSLHELLERLEILEKRMNAVLIPMSTTEQEGPGVKQPYEDSQYVTQLRDLTSLIRRAINKVDNISNRVQV
jgi:hypothetical protein